MTMRLYSDPLVEMTEENIVIRGYSLLLQPKSVRWEEVESVKALQPTLWTGRWRMSGTGCFSTWFATDFARPARETIFIMKLRTQSMKVGFTAHDAGRVKQILAERGLLIDEQGDARPAPLPAETRPFWRWPAVYALLAVVLGLFAQIIYYYPRLPETVATHFNWRGEADAWGPKAALVGAMILAAVLVGGSMFAIGYAIARTPAALVGRFILWFAVATLGLIVVIAQLSFRANLTPAQSMGTAALLYALLAYFGAIVLGVVLLVRRLARPV